MTTNNKQRVTLFLNSSLLKYAKTQAVIEGLSLTNLTEKALVNYLPKETIIKKTEIKLEGGEGIWQKLKKKR